MLACSATGRCTDSAQGGTRRWSLPTRRRSSSRSTEPGRGDRSPLRAWLHRARPLRRLRDRARSVDAPVARTDADASLRARRCRRHPLYVSAQSGDVVLRTTARERFWGYLGPVTHWVYFTPLRKNGSVWSEFIIWSSLIGCVMCVTGLVWGLWRYSPRSRFRLKRVPSQSPYSGMLKWHHYAGLLFGVITHDLDVQRPALDGAIQLVFVAGDHGRAARGVYRRTASTGAAHARQAAFCGHGDRIVVPSQPWRWTPEGARGHAIPR